MPAPPDAGEAPEVLLVEDNAVEAELVLLGLRRSFPALRAEMLADGEDLLERLLGPRPQRAPRVILLDLKLQRVGGLETLRRLKGEARTRAIPVVVLTSSGLDADVAAGYEHGANSYVVKPMEFTEFRRVVDDIGRYWLGLNQTPEEP